MAVCSAPFQRQPLGLRAAAATDVDAFTSEKTHQVGHTRLVLMIDCCGAISPLIDCSNQSAYIYFTYDQP